MAATDAEAPRDETLAEEAAEGDRSDRGDPHEAYEEALEAAEGDCGVGRRGEMLIAFTPCALLLALALYALLLALALCALLLALLGTSLPALLPPVCLWCPRLLVLSCTEMVLTIRRARAQSCSVPSERAIAPSAVEMQARTRQCASPPRESCNSDVSSEARYGG